jgi:hypothetical protein
MDDQSAPRTDATDDLARGAASGDEAALAEL